MKCISKDTSKVERVEIITKAEDGDLLMLTPQMLETLSEMSHFQKWRLLILVRPTLCLSSVASALSTTGLPRFV